MDTDSNFDFIIVGAGLSGCVPANRLASDPATKVLLIESRPDDKSPLIRESQHGKVKQFIELGRSGGVRPTGGQAR